MSEMEAYSGKLTPIELNSKTHEEYFRSLFKDNKILEDYYDNWEEKADEELDREFVVINEDLFEINAVEQDPSSLCAITAQEDGTYDFVAIYYNGGTYLKEVLEDAFDGNED